MNKNSFRKYIPLNITYLSKINKLTQNEFGELFGLGRSAVSHYVSQKTIPQLETVVQICDYFKISIDDFIRTDLSQRSNKVIREYSAGVQDQPSDNTDTIRLYKALINEKDKRIEGLERENDMLRKVDADNNSGKTA